MKTLTSQRRAVTGVSLLAIFIRVGCLLWLFFSFVEYVLLVNLSGYHYLIMEGSSVPLTTQSVMVAASFAVLGIMFATPIARLCFRVRARPIANLLLKAKSIESR